ncbi:uncharacterized protein METZ01_LOCUS461994, partial [marine metagenome]
CLVDDPDLTEVFRMLHAAEFELWFHGHTHDWTLPEAEFSGVSVERQRQSMARGIVDAREVWGIEFHTFGAPGNAIDANTTEALKAFPQIVVWFYGREDTNLMLLPRILEAESVSGTMATPGAFATALDSLIEARSELPVTTLQVHPNQWIEEEFQFFGQILEGIQSRGRFRYTSPYGWWRWQRDLGKIEVTKLSRVDYVVDLRKASFAHTVEIAPSLTQGAFQFTQIDEGGEVPGPSWPHDTVPINLF